MPKTSSEKSTTGKSRVHRTARRSVAKPPRGIGARASAARVSEAAKARALRLADALRARYPDAVCELVHENPFQLLIATILSAQTTDVGVNKVTPGLFRRFPDAGAFARAQPTEVEPFIRSIGLYRNKARNIVGASRMLVERFGGEVPRTMAELILLPGVARKTANVVLGNCFGINEGFVVDTHIQRLAVRFGLAKEGDDVRTIERKLMALFPRERWCELSHQIIRHGRRVCKARGGACGMDEICRGFGVCGKRRGGR